MSRAAEALPCASRAYRASRHQASCATTCEISLPALLFLRAGAHANRHPAQEVSLPLPGYGIAGRPHGCASAPGGLVGRALSRGGRPTVDGEELTVCMFRAILLGSRLAATRVLRDRGEPDRGFARTI